MNNPLKSPAASNLGILLARLPLGYFFFFAGFWKLTDLGVKKFVDMNTKNLPAFLPRPVGQTYLYAIPFLEMIVGTMLAFGFLTRTTAFVASLMIVSFIIGATGVVNNDNWMLLNFNVVYIGIALLLTTTGGGKISLDRAFFGDGGRF